MIYLPKVNKDISYTLIYYLYTGNYKTLRLYCASNSKEKVIKYKRSVLVYYVIRVYKINGLIIYAKV